MSRSGLNFGFIPVYICNSIALVWLIRLCLPLHLFLF
uniref:Uncharacterized protein n=1 Tax=Rhizophora mucronata TaxID=61149 RepID=A0A2P2NIS9_RHIMU